MRPLIGIPCHALIRAETGRPIYASNRAYVHALESAGGLPILIPMINDLNILTALLARLDGLLLPGGTDVHPSRYGEEVHPFTEKADIELDEFEITLASWAFQQDIPVLGICRGMQLINVALGGSLYQAIKDPGKGVRITGRAPDGIPELLEVIGYRFVMAAQSHPEEIYSIEPAFARLFSAFVKASSSRMDEEIVAGYSISRREETVGAGQ